MKMNTENCSVSVEAKHALDSLLVLLMRHVALDVVHELQASKSARTKNIEARARCLSLPIYARPSVKTVHQQTIQANKQSDRQIVQHHKWNRIML